MVLDKHTNFTAFPGLLLATIQKVSAPGQENPGKHNLLFLHFSFCKMNKNEHFTALYG